MQEHRPNCESCFSNLFVSHLLTFHCVRYVMWSSLESEWEGTENFHNTRSRYEEGEKLVISAIYLLYHSVDFFSVCDVISSIIAFPLSFWGALLMPTPWMWVFPRISSLVLLFLLTLCIPPPNSGVLLLHLHMYPFSSQMEALVVFHTLYFFTPHAFEHSVTSSWQLYCP